MAQSGKLSRGACSRGSIGRFFCITHSKGIGCIACQIGKFRRILPGLSAVLAVLCYRTVGVRLYRIQGNTGVGTVFQRRSTCRSRLRSLVDCDITSRRLFLIGNRDLDRAGGRQRGIGGNVELSDGLALTVVIDRSNREIILAQGSAVRDIRIFSDHFDVGKLA